MNLYLPLTLIVGIVAILHHTVSYVRSARFEIIAKYIDFLQLTDVDMFSMVIQMIGGTLTAVIYDVGVAVVLVSEVINKRPCNKCLNEFYFRHVSAMGGAI